MPLSDPAPRELLHTRVVECRGFQRVDGLWDIEGHLTDVKTYTFTNNWRGSIEPGDPIHEMWVRLTLDDDMVIRAIEVQTDKSPFHTCPEITPNFQSLQGLRIAAGFTVAVRERLGGTAGCTHLVELMGPVATTAFQTIYPARQRQRQQSEEGHKRRPMLLNTCHAFSSSGEVVKREFPDFYTGPQSA